MERQKKDRLTYKINNAYHNYIKYSLKASAKTYVKIFFRGGGTRKYK